MYVFVWFLVACVVPIASYFYPGLADFSTIYGLSSFIGLAGYVFLGAYVFERISSVHSSISIKTEVVIFIFSSGLTALLTYALSVSEGSPNQLFYSYLSPIVVFSSVSAFKLMVVLGARCAGLSKLLSVLSGCTLGVYCIHVFVMNRFSLIYGEIVEGHSNLWVIPVLSVSIFILSIIPVYTLRLVKPLRQIV